MHRRRPQANAAVKVLTVLGTRPEIIRLSRVIARLDRAAEHVLVHTGQNFDEPRATSSSASSASARRTSISGIRASSARRADGADPRAARARSSRARSRTALLILGDTNSGLAAVVAARMGIPVYHMEAGNRCFDDRVPEEINRRVIDHSQRRPHALHPAQPGEPHRGGDRTATGSTSRGNPIFEVIEHSTARRSRRARSWSVSALTSRAVLPRYAPPRRERGRSEDGSRGSWRGARPRRRRLGQPAIVSLHPRTGQAAKVERGRRAEGLRCSLTSRSASSTSSAWRARRGASSPTAARSRRRRPLPESRT